MINEPLDLPNAAAAIHKYDATWPEDLRPQPDDFMPGLKGARDDVREAFYHDTKDRNTYSACMSTPLGHIRALVKAYIERLKEEEPG
jgi:hypothetical protein